MVGEAVAAALVGMAGLVLVLQPLFRAQQKSFRPPEPLDPEETPRGVALSALKEIDFDRETGKLSDADYQFLKAKYTAIALEALRAESAGKSLDAIEAAVSGELEPRCRVCGPRPEADAIFCSTCGSLVAGGPAPEILPSPGIARVAAPAAVPPNPLQAH